MLLTLVAFWFAVRAIHGIHFLSFGDESGHLLGARAIRAGDRLYRDFIDAHGPLNFMAAQIFGVAFGWKEPLHARWGIVVLVVSATWAIFRSPVFQQTTSRLWGAALFLGFMSASWLVQSLNMVNYHGLGGVLTAVVLASTIVPPWFGKAASSRATLLCGFCLALLCAAAYSLAPTAILLTASAACALWKEPGLATLKSFLVNVAAGFAAGCLLVLVWLLCFGDVLGYVVFHIINMQVNYARYIPFGWRFAFRSLVPSTASEALVQSGATFMYLASLLMLIALRGAAFRARPFSRLLSLTCLAAGILMMNFRGAFGFQDGGFLIASIALFALTLPAAIAAAAGAPLSSRLSWGGSIIIGVVLASSEIVDRHAITSPHRAKREDFSIIPRARLAVDYRTPIYRRIRSILKPDERLLVLVYNPDFFLPAGFLPVRKYHEFLPWEADYARHPWFGYTRDLCTDLSASPPPVIVYEPWKVWDIWTPESFMRCVPDMLKKSYVADTIPSLYIRRDRLTSGSSPK